MPSKEPVAVSVIITCYNHARYIGQAIQSVLDQSFSEFEIIVVDDGSTDNSLALIKKFADKRITVIAQDNAGPSVSTLKAMQSAKGSLLVLLAGDDYCAPYRLEQQVGELTDPNVGLTFCLPQLVDEDGRSLPDSAWPAFFKPMPKTPAELLSHFFFEGNFICGTSAMIRRSLLEEQGPWHCGMVQLQDFDKWIALTQHCEFRRSDVRHTFYRVRNQSGNLSSNRNRWRALVERRLVYRHFFDKLDPRFIAEAFADLVAQEDVCATKTKGELTYPIYLAHRDPVIQMIGIELLIDGIASPDDYKHFQSRSPNAIWDVFETARELYPRSLRKELKRLKRSSAGPIQKRVSDVRKIVRRSLVNALGLRRPT